MAAIQIDADGVNSIRVEADGTLIVVKQDDDFIHLDAAATRRLANVLTCISMGLDVPKEQD